MTCWQSGRRFNGLASGNFVEICVLQNRSLERQTNIGPKYRLSVSLNASHRYPIPMQFCFFPLPFFRTDKAFENKLAAWKKSLRTLANFTRIFPMTKRTVITIQRPKITIAKNDERWFQWQCDSLSSHFTSFRRWYNLTESRYDLLRLWLESIWISPHDGPSTICR